MVLCTNFPSSLPQQKDLLLIYYVDCFPERSALFSVKTLFQHHFFLSRIMFMEQDVTHTISSFHQLTSSIETAPHAAWRSPSSQKYMTLRDFLDHLLHLSLLNTGVFIQLGCCYLEGYSLWFLSKIILSYEISQSCRVSPGFCHHFVLFSYRTLPVQVFFLEWQVLCFCLHFRLLCFP